MQTQSQIAAHDAKGNVKIMSYPDLLERQTEIKSRLQCISIHTNDTPETVSNKKDSNNKETKSSTSSATLQYTPKSDTHWDYLLKEMQWLSADFHSERKRQTSKARKLSQSIKQFHSTKEKRHLRALADIELRKRKLAAKIARNVVKGWWKGKIERVIAYKQKVDADLIRKRAMDKHLVFLVKQTEQYGDRLKSGLYHSGSNDHDCVSSDGDEHKVSSKTIEEVLQLDNEETLNQRKSRSRMVDYNRLNTELQSSDFHEPLTSDDYIGDNDDNEDDQDSEDYIPDDEDDVDMMQDDESTFSEAERMDSYEREKAIQLLNLSQTQSLAKGNSLLKCNFGSDLNEVDKLIEEGEMDIELVLERLKHESAEYEKLCNEYECEIKPTGDENNTVQNETDEAIITMNLDTHPTAKKVTFNLPPDTSHSVQNDQEDMDVDNKPTLTQDNEMSGDSKTIEKMNDMNDDNTDNETSTYETNIATDTLQMLDSDDISHSSSKSSGSEDFTDEGNEMVDDETTIEAEEKLGRDMSYEEELALLKKENEMSIEELRAMYLGALGDSNTNNQEDDELDEDDDSDTTDNDKSENENDSIQEMEIEREYNDDHSGSEDFEPSLHDAIDDETTIEAEERLGREMSYEEEISLLQRENEMSIEELRKLYYSNVPDQQLESDEGSASEESTDSSLDILAKINTAENDEYDEFVPPDVDELDDETTIEVEERLGREISYEKELALLQQESEIPIDQLRSMYENVLKNNEFDENESKKRNQPDSDTVDSLVTKKIKVENNEGSDSSHEDEDADDDASVDEGEAALRLLEVSDAKARQTTVSRPFLLSKWVKLREYQQIGLNWLVSIQTRRLNGILADEMGLGKTLQTISLLAYLASFKGIWGPHLIIVPTSCIVNWEVELKRFCPAFKVLCYYGSAKRRKELRQGWTKTNTHHVIVTSYQLAVQDSFAFKRKKWYYLILDEAQNIKNFESQRWQTLVNFNTQRRLLLTGTPLQNNLMELWSLLHFLMPYVFRSRKEFSYWFSNPMSNIVEGNASRNDDLISRLHGIIRPFVLRRLKKDVETQLPGKYEHIVKCQLSRRQMFLYEEYMARSSTRNALGKGGNYMGMMNVLLQLRKVCNHPDLFEPRAIITPFFMEALEIPVPSCASNIFEQKTTKEILSPHLLHPLWSIGCGEPSFDQNLKFDEFHATRLNKLQTIPSEIAEKVSDQDITEPLLGDENNGGLQRFLRNIWTESKITKDSVAKLQARVNSWRCSDHSFPYPLATLDIVNVDIKFHTEHSKEDIKIAETPLQLLEMRKSQEERAELFSDIIERFVFCVPKAGARSPVLKTRRLDAEAIYKETHLAPVMTKSFQSYFKPFIKSNARLTSFFPDKKLVQFDAGKLQALSELLRSLKQNGHRVLIFTQMSKMLDVLETFLNLNGHTYLRLDGSTGVESRQRMMDRFNNDTKIFCFILSTRSGGLGINLTGADTVIFYDSDWNPAMDAQAQDRAHRIGQTRDVHIYRLVTEHTIEENILIKAKQKRHLDYLVMDEGKFHSIPSIQDGKETNEEVDDTEHVGNSDVFSKTGLRGILGLSDRGEDKSHPANNIEASNIDDEPDVSKEQIEHAMTSLEDEDDVMAMRGAQKEAAQELEEFDETIRLKKDDDDNESQDSRDGDEVKSEKKSNPNELKIESNITGDNADNDNEEQLEEEFAAWQKKVGIDKESINASLIPTERYALRYREDIDPFYSIWFLSEQQRMKEAAAMDEEFDVEAIEALKAEEERRAIEEGDLLATQPFPEELPRQRQLYIREKSRLQANKKRRKLTGENWETRVDGRTKYPFWYNTDTGEATWDKPKLLIDLQAEQDARDKGWESMMMKPLLLIMEFLLPYPERMACARVCRQWRAAAQDISFVKHVYPVEMGALAMDRNKMERYHYRTISEALVEALPGDTIELGDGHYWINDPEVHVDVPLRIIGDEKDPNHVVVELSGTVIWKAIGGLIEGVTFRRPKISSTDLNEKSLMKLVPPGKHELVSSLIIDR